MTRPAAGADGERRADLEHRAALQRLRRGDGRPLPARRIGFIKAVKGFDLHYGTQFSTYAVPKIAGEIRRFLRDDGTVKVSRGIKERALHIKNARCALEQRLGRVPLISELAAETGLTPEDIAFAETAANPAESLQRETGEDGFTLEHVLCDTEGEERMIEHVALPLRH